MLESKLEVNTHTFLFGNFLLMPREGSYSRLRQGSIKGNSAEAPSRKQILCNNKNFNFHMDMLWALSITQDAGGYY